MTTGARDKLDPLARIGRQIVVAAEHRAHRRRRRRTLLAVSAGTLTLGAAVGVAAVETDIVGPTEPLAPHYAEHGSDRVDLHVSEGLERPWTVATYRTIGAGLCIAVAPSTERAPQVQCGAAVVTSEELDRAPVTSVAGTVVQRGVDGDDVLVYGLARPDVEQLQIEPAGGAISKQVLDGATLDVPAARSRKEIATAPVLTVRPFAVLVAVPPDTDRVRLTSHTRDGSDDTRTVAVTVAQPTP